MTTLPETMTAIEIQGKGGPEVLAPARIGVPQTFVASIEHTAETLTAFAQAVILLQHLGAEIVDIDPDGLAESHDAGSLIIRAEAYRYHRATLEREPNKLSVNLRARFAKAHLVTDDQVTAARRAMQRLRQSVSALFAEGLTAIVNPARERPAQTMAELVADPLGKRSLALRMYSVTGHPALVLPMGFTQSGLPLGLQIAAAHQREDLVYQIADAYEQSAGWWLRRPEP